MVFSAIWSTSDWSRRGPYIRNPVYLLAETKPLFWCFVLISSCNLFSGHICRDLGLANIGNTEHNRSGGKYRRVIRGPLRSHVSRKTRSTGCESRREARAVPEEESLRWSFNRFRDAEEKTLRAEKIPLGILPGTINKWRPHHLWMANHTDWIWYCISV